MMRSLVHMHTATVPSRLPRIRRRLRAVSAPSPRGRYGKFVARQRKRRQIATFNQVRSARLNSGSQRRDLYRRALAEVPWQSCQWLAVVHEVTAEQRRPSDIEMMRSLSNRQPPRESNLGVS